MIDNFLYLCVIAIWIGIGISAYSTEASKKRCVGWLIATIATFADGVLVIMDKRPVAGGIIIIFSFFDLYILYYNYKMYRNKVTSDREDFLNKIKKYKK